MFLLSSDETKKVNPKNLKNSNMSLSIDFSRTRYLFTDGTLEQLEPAIQEAENQLMSRSAPETIFSMARSARRS